LEIELEQSRVEVRAAMASLGVGVLLLAVKFAAYLLTGSSAIFSDALESIVNVAASGMAWYSIVLAHRPADTQHPYGHGKVEFMSAAIEGGMMFVAALVILLRAVEQLWRGASIDTASILWGLVLIVAAMLINGALGLHLIRAGKRGGSITLEADGKHLLADAVTSAGVLVALLLVKLTGIRRLDPLAAIAIAAYVAYEGVHLIRRSTAGLMDEQDLEDDRLLRSILDSHVGDAGHEPQICSYHKLRHRHSGRYHWVDFHLVVPGTWDIDHGHHVATAIEKEIETALKQGDATAHVEPCVQGTCPRCSAHV
jgi:cation diffusion facilitator family transporter